MSTCTGNDFHKALIYIDPYGKPKFSNVAYTDDKGVATVAYPNQFCTAHTSAVYPNTDRAEFQPSTVKLTLGRGEPCLGNEGTMIITTSGDKFPSDLCYARIDDANNRFKSCGGCNVVYDGNNITYMTPTKRTGRNNYITAIGSILRTITEGEVDSYSSSEPMACDDYVVNRPNYSGVDIPDELGNNQPTGGQSFVCVSVSMIVSAGPQWSGSIGVRIPSRKTSSLTRPEIRMEEVNREGNVPVWVRPLSGVGSVDETFLLVDAVQVLGFISSSDYFHVFSPFVRFSGFDREHTYRIQDYSMSIRLYDTILNGPR